MALTNFYSFKVLKNSSRNEEKKSTFSSFGGSVLNVIVGYIGKVFTI